MGHQPHALCGQAYPPTDPLQQGGPNLALQGRKLLRHGRGGKSEGGAHRGYGSAMGKFSKQPETREIKHKENLTKDASLLKWICEDAGR